MATDLPNPFWSEAVQQEFQRTQQQSETAGDRDATTMREIDETQNEPTYQLDAREQVPPGTVGLAAEGQTVQGEPGSGDHSGERPGHDAVQVHPDVASPAPRSVAGLSVGLVCVKLELMTESWSLIMLLRLRHLVCNLLC